MSDIQIKGLGQNNIIDNTNTEIINHDEKTDVVKSQLHTFTATDKNLAIAFADLLSGKKVPSEITIIDPNTGKESPELKKDLCKAAVKVATALMTANPGRETVMGFVLGDFTVELRRENSGKFFLTIEGLETENNNIIDEEIDIAMPEKDIVEDNNIREPEYFNKQVDVNDTTSKFASMIIDDVLQHPELYKEDTDNDEYVDKGRKGSFGALEQLLVAGEQSPKSIISRSQLVDALKLRLNLEPNELVAIGTKTLSHWASQSVLDPKMTVASIRKEINEYTKNPIILESVNSIEADKDMEMLEKLLEKTPNIVNSKVDISNIGQVRTDPQEGMTPKQKIIHSFIADLVMPADTSLYDSNEGKGANRIREVMLQHPEAVKILMEDGFNTGVYSLEGIPESFKAAILPVLNNMIIELTSKYPSLLKNENEQKALGDQIQKGQAQLQLDLVKTLIGQISMDTFEKLDGVINTAVDKAAEEQQQLVTEKFTATLLNNDEANKKLKFVPADQIDFKKVVNDIRKTPKPTPEMVRNDPEGAEAINKQRNRELVKAVLEVYKLNKEVFLAGMKIRKTPGSMKMSIQDNQSVNGLLDFFMTLWMNGVPNAVEPKDYFTDEGRAFFDTVILNEEAIYNTLMPTYQDMFERYLTRFLAENDDSGKTAMQKDLEAFLRKDVLKQFNIDLLNPTLSQMSAEPDEFNKPGMGKLIKNVLMSYFSTKPIEPQLPEGLSQDHINLAKTLAASKDANPKLPAGLTEEQQTMLREAISAIREANTFNEKLPELLKTRMVDKRSMISSMIRYSNENTSDASKLGAMLKGAGPLMHKLLQGLELPGMDPDFKTALDDMKSNLNPIDPKYVQAQMLKLVESSNGSILKLSINKPLGAASVGQAFLVTVTPKDGEAYQAVLKIIRPEVSVKTKREFEQFMIEAKRIPGMEDTYKGLYDQYKKEFSLQLEADNIKLGQQVYNDGIDMDRVETMSLVDGIPATETSMLIKQAPGDTLDRYIKKTKARIDEIRSTPVTTMEQYINNRLELQTLYRQMRDINQSLGVTAKKWLNKCLFAESGFFHGDMHPGNLMVAPSDPTDPQSKTKITIIDYGNASKLTEAQTKAILKVNVACSFGGVYQFEADSEQKPIVEKNTVNMFLSGFKALLSEGDRKLFEKREKELVDNVIKPVLLKGAKNEVGVRLALLIRKLQQAGIPIPGAIINMAESEKRLSNGIDELNAITDEVESMLLNYHPAHMGETSDPIYGLVYKSVTKGDAFTERKYNEFKEEFSYDLNANAKVVDEMKKSLAMNNNTQVNGDNIDPKQIEDYKKEVKANYEKFRQCEARQTKLLMRIEDGFKYPLEDMWDKKAFLKSGGATHAEYKQIDDMLIGLYQLSPKESDPLYDLHKKFLDARSKISEDTLKQIRECEKSLSDNRRGSFEKITEARDTIAGLSKTNPDVAEYMQIREQMAAIIKERMLSLALTIKNEMPNANPATDPRLGNKKDLTTVTVDMVTDKVSGIRNALSFAGEMGYGFLDLTLNRNKARTYFEILGDKFLDQEHMDRINNAVNVKN